MTDCRYKAQIKVSDPSGWIGKYCFRHTVKLVTSQLRNIKTRMGFALYLQRYLTKSEAEAIARSQRAS